MSTISQIYGRYREALAFSRDRFERLYSSRARNAHDFYHEFFHRLVCRYAVHFADPASRRALHRQIEQFFGTREINFVAIDGTCAKDSFQDFVVFSACAYGARGQVSLNDEPPAVRYQKWALDKDVSMVTYVPVPFAEFADVAEQEMPETFLVADGERANLSNIHVKIMELAEIYLAYSVASSSTIEAPKMIMLDRSLASMLADVALQPEAIPMLHYPFDRRQLTVEDITVALAHPFNPSLGVPSLKKFRQYAAIIAEMHRRHTRAINLDEFAARHNLTRADLYDAITYLTRPRAPAPFARAESRDGATWMVAGTDCVSAWEYCVGLFENICRRTFIEKDQQVLLYEVSDEVRGSRLRWLSPDDVRFLIAIGLRALIEKCWERKILLTGITKDSLSSYLTRNYLGVMKHLGAGGYPELATIDVWQLPWTDRIFLELLPMVDETLDAPWASIEFDSAFMTLHVQEGPAGQPVISGIRGFIVAPERILARSLAQFFLNRDKDTPLAGHVVFVERLVYPEWDRQALERLAIETPALGTVEPLCYPTRDELNLGQLINMYLLNILARNHFPEAIGYPDPLHKADWGARSVGRNIRDIIKSSTFSFRSRPLSRTFRDIRDSFRRL